MKLTPSDHDFIVKYKPNLKRIIVDGRIDKDVDDAANKNDPEVY